jgi:hypothetical protein
MKNVAQLSSKNRDVRIYQYPRVFPMTKDYLTPLEAAEYACVPLADFEALADSCGVLSFQYIGQRVYHHYRAY